jgi:hypothetical protein
MFFMPTPSSSTDTTCSGRVGVSAEGEICVCNGSAVQLLGVNDLDHEFIVGRARDHHNVVTRSDDVSPQRQLDCLLDQALACTMPSHAGDVRGACPMNSRR